MAFEAERYQRVVLPEDFLQSNHAVFGKSGLLGADGCLERFDIWYHQRSSRSRRRPAGRQIQSEDEVIVFDVQLGSKLTGHEGLVHGGIISLLFDEAIGWGYQCVAHEDQCRDNESHSRPETAGRRGSRHAHADKRPERAHDIQWKDLDGTPPAVTANLNVTYKQPLPAGQRCLLRVYHTQSEGRKHHFHASLEMLCDSNARKNSSIIGGTAPEKEDVMNRVVIKKAVVYAEANCLMVAVVSDKLPSRL